MPESSKKVRIDLDRSIIPIINIKGKKRHVEEIVEEQVVSSKRQKTVCDTSGCMIQPAVDVNILKKKKRVEKKKKRREKKPMKESSCEESSDKEDEPKKPVAAETKIVAATKKDDSSGKSESEKVKNRSNDSGKKMLERSNDSDDEESKPSYKKQSVVPMSEEYDEEPKKPVEGKTKNVITTKRYEPRPPFPPPPGGYKLVFMGNLSPCIKESDVLEFFKDAGKIEWVRFTCAEDRFLGYGHVRFDTSEAAQKAVQRNGEELIGRAVKLKLSEERSIFDMFTPSSEYKYLFMGNLHPDIKESEIIDFFKDAGKVVSVYLIREGGHFLGYGNVKFASSTIAYKALRRYGHMLRGRPVELVLETERTVWFSYTPSSGIRRHRV